MYRYRLGRVLRTRLRLEGPVLALSATATAKTEVGLNKLNPVLPIARERLVSTLEPIK